MKIRGLFQLAMKINSEKNAEIFFFINGFVAVSGVFLIGFFVFYKGFQPFIVGDGKNTYSLLKFLCGMHWNPNDCLSKAYYGIFYMIVGSVLSVGGAIFIAFPIGIFTSIYAVELAPSIISKIIKSSVEVLAGIPSVLYGIFGLGVLVPTIMKISPYNKGQSLLAVVIVLSIMILPMIISLSINAIESVPKSYKEASYALGATKIYTIFKVIIPASKSGISSGVILGISRAIGETMAVMLVAGNPNGGIPESIWHSIRPLTTNIALEMSYAFGIHQQMLFATGIVLFCFIICINIVLYRINKHIKL